MPLDVLINEVVKKLHLFVEIKIKKIMVRLEQFEPIVTDIIYIGTRVYEILMCHKSTYIDSNSLSKFFIPGYSTKLNKGHGNGLPNIKIISKNNVLINLVLPT